MKNYRLKLLLPLVVIAIVAAFFRAPLRRMLFEQTALHNPAPTPEVVAELIENATDPRSALLAAWRSGKIVQREVAIREVGDLFPVTRELPPEFESLLLAAALDPDMNVRQTALGRLRERHHPALAALAAEQLKDADEQIRLLGLEYLKPAPAATGIPLAAALLNDPDIAVAGTSIKLLEQWSGEEFGARLVDTVQVENQTNRLLEFQPEGIARTRAAAAKAAAWWTRHQSQYPPVKLELPPPARSGRSAVPAADFELRTLDGQPVRLSDYRGKVVLINFWTTWCTACVGEMPALLALQKAHPDNLVVLGVSLDFVPDEDGEGSAPPAVEDQGKPLPGTNGENRRAGSAVSAKSLREKIARTVKARGLSYPVLLDEHFEAGGRYNGGELPTTIIVDQQGNVRRRFVGARSLPVFEAMIAEASTNHDQL